MADGASDEEAVANARVVIDEWLETAKGLGREISKPQRRLAIRLKQAR